MWGLEFHRETVTIDSTTTSPTPGPRGVPVRTTTTRAIEGCNVQQVGTSESIGAQEMVTDRYRVSCSDLQTWVQQGDIVHLEWTPNLFTVEGRPSHLRGGALDHTEFVITSTKGG